MFNNILFVVPRLPYPADTGAKIRTLNLLKIAVQNNNVSLLSFYFEENKDAIEKLKRLGIKLHLVKSRDDLNPFTFFSRKPISIKKYRSKRMGNKLKDLVSNNDFDLIHFDHLHIGQYSNCINGKPCILDDHNVETVLLDRCASTERNFIKKMLYKSQSRKMSRIESGLATSFSKCLVVSEEDKKSLSTLSGRNDNIEVIPNGADTEYFKAESRKPKAESNSLVFTGSMDWLPNIDAVEYFCRDILPLIWEKKPGIKFYIVGKKPPAKIRRLSNNDIRISVTDSVKDVRPFIAKSKVFVVPLRIGGGSRLKILEALSMEKAVVTTSLGAEGLDVTKGKHLLIADTPRDFAEKVINLMEDNGLREELGINGRALVKEKYDWNVIGKKLNEIYKNMVVAHV